MLRYGQLCSKNERHCERVLLYLVAHVFNIYEASIEDLWFMGNGLQKSQRKNCELRFVVRLEEIEYNCRNISDNSLTWRDYLLRHHLKSICGVHNLRRSARSLKLKNE